LEGLGHKKVHELGWHGRKVYNELLHKAEIVELDDDADVYYDTATMEIRYFGGCKRGGKIFFNRAKFVAEEHHEVRRAEVVPPPPPPPKIVLPPPVRVVVQAPPPPPRPVNHWICREFKTPIMRCNVRIGWHHESFWVLVDSYNRPIRGAQRLPYRPGFNPNHREYAERAEQRQFQEERNDAPNPTSYAQRDDRRFQERRQPQRDQVFDDIQRELGN
jgi:hypothetical protein